MSTFISQDWSIFRQLPDTIPLDKPKIWTMEVWLPTPIKNKATRFHNRVQPQTFTPCYSGFSPFKHTTEFSIEFANIRCRMTSKNMMSRACQELKHHPLPPHPETHSGIPKINQIWREASHLFVLNMKRLKGYGKGNIKWNNNLKKLILAKTHFFSIYKTMNFFFLQFLNSNCVAQSH